MTFDQLVYNMQQAVIALGIFVCLWGFFEFWPCLKAVLLKRPYPHGIICPHHAGGGMICVVGIIFASARANTIDWFPFGQTTAGLLFIAGMIVFCLMIALGIWAKEKAQITGQLISLKPPQLSWIFSMMIIVILSFVLVGLVKAAQ
jgi:hypothetical protein